MSLATDIAITGLLEMAADEYDADGVISLTVQTSLAELGYDLRGLEAAVSNISNSRRTFFAA